MTNQCETKFIESQRDCVKYSKYDPTNPEINKTNKFKFLPNNRPIDETHVNTLVESLKACGSFHGYIIIIKTKCLSDNNRPEYYIGDGQHRMMACAKLGIPFNYEVVSLVDDTLDNLVKYISLLNDSSKTWSLPNYLNAYAMLDIPGYAKLNVAFTEHGLTTSDLISIYNPNKSLPHATKEFKLGKFSPCDEADSDILLESFVMMKHAIPSHNMRRVVMPIMRQVVHYRLAGKAIQEAGDVMAEHEAYFPKDEVELTKMFISNLIKADVVFKTFDELKTLTPKKRDRLSTLKTTIARIRRKLAE